MSAKAKSGPQQRYRQKQADLTSLMNTNPAAAIAEARKLPDDGKNWSLLRATILCDAGGPAADLSAVEESSQIFLRLVESLPSNGALKYNLANSFTVRAQLDRTQSPDWYLKTALIRREARTLLGEAGELDDANDPSLASQMLTNLGNALDTSHRWVEAYDCYQHALALHPENGVASGCAAQVLGRIGRLGLLPHSQHLLAVALRLAHHAKEHRDVVIDFAGPGAADEFDALPSEEGELVGLQLPRNASAYQGFVSEHRLLLSPVLEGISHEPRRWDDAHITTISEAIGTGATVPAVFAMFNVMKADYLVARELLFEATRLLEGDHGTEADTGLYMDTLDYAVYGTTPSRLVLAQRTALDLLDKIAVALNEHLAIGLKAKDVYFLGLWREKPSDAQWRPSLASHIGQGNPALIALSEIAADLTDGSHEGSVPGFLYSAKRARHAGTHRFVVLHDMGPGESRETPAVEHHDLVEFQKIVMRTVRLARAALLHFLEVVAYKERANKKDGGRSISMMVPSHHQIRGDE